jgi:hypothetical protein
MLDSPLPLYEDFATRRNAVIPTLAQTTLIVILAIALWKRHPWAGYGLIVLATMDAISRGVAFGSLAGVLTLFFVFAYWVGTKSVRRIDHVAPPLHDLHVGRIISLSIVCVAVHWALYLLAEIGYIRHSVSNVLGLGWDAALMAHLVTKESEYTFEKVIVFWLGIVMLDVVGVFVMNALPSEQTTSVSVQIVIFFLRHIVVLLPLALIAWGISETTRWLAAQRLSKKLGASL